MDKSGPYYWFTAPFLQVKNSRKTILGGGLLLKPVSSHRSNTPSYFLCKCGSACRTGIWTSGALQHEKGYPSLSQGVARNCAQPWVRVAPLQHLLGEVRRSVENSQLQLPNWREDSWAKSCDGVCGGAQQWNQCWFHFLYSLLQAVHIKGFSNCGCSYLTSRKTADWMSFCSHTSSKAALYSSCFFKIL